MTFLSRLFGGPSGGGEESTEAAMCGQCGSELDETEMEEDYCEDCLSSYSGPKYCCGSIYEEGEDTCMSCGEPI